MAASEWNYRRVIWLLLMPHSHMEQKDDVLSGKHELNSKVEPASEIWLFASWLYFCPQHLLPLSANDRRQCLHLSALWEADCSRHFLVALFTLDPRHTHSKAATRLSSSIHAGWVSAPLRCPWGPAGPLIFSQATCVSLISIWLWGYSRSHSRTRWGQMHRAALLMQSIFLQDQRKTNVKH